MKSYVFIRSFAGIFPIVMKSNNSLIEVITCSVAESHIGNNYY